MKLPVKYKNEYHIATESFFVGKQEYVVVDGHPVMEDEIEYLDDSDYFDFFMKKDQYYESYGCIIKEVEDGLDFTIQIFLGDFSGYYGEVIPYGSVLRVNSKVLEILNELNNHVEILNNIHERERKISEIQEKTDN